MFNYNSFIVMSNVYNSLGKTNAINEGKKIVLPRGAQRAISESLNTARSFVSSTISKYENGEPLKGEKEMAIVEIAIRQSKAYKSKMFKLAKA
jgi:hypothetical protein